MATHQFLPYLFHLLPELVSVLANTFLSFIFIQNSSFIALGIPMFTQNLQKVDVGDCKYGFPQIMKMNSNTIIGSDPFM